MEISISPFLRLKLTDNFPSFDQGQPRQSHHSQLRQGDSPISPLFGPTEDQLNPTELFAYNKMMGSDMLRFEIFKGEKEKG